ncbi:uncharacterized protein sS8_1073 [Methylocaldum marinum]|uniref:Uncharacterized protein n=1 Tax=Methylocaldum marinum TaxID=1432792 RepID=A0A250KN09_9GAMM|nr:type VI secretion system tip protein VgrG [Methylocaldum marinum]BBA33035.1 uncharacterized protein sS8_1073 [Methylocaldum marinum]
MKFIQKTRLIQVFSPLGPDILLFHRMQGLERLGGLFDYELDLLSANGAINADQLLGDRLDVALTLPDDSVRYFNGVVCRFAQLGGALDPDRTLVHYRVTLRPWLWLLTRTSDCRIFQKKTAPDIIAQVFRDHGFTDFEARLSLTYPQREYCVQYRESDFNFVSRLMEEEGIYYFFEHAKGKHTLILADAAAAHPKVPGYESIPYFEPNNSARRLRDHLFSWSFAREIQPGCCVLTDYDFTKPMADLQVKRQQPRPHAQAEWEVFDYPGQYAQVEHGEHYASTRLEELHARHELVQARGNAQGLACGALFGLTDYPREDQNREYLIVSAEYRLQSNAYLSEGPVLEEEAFDCTLTALDSRQPYRPARETVKPAVRGPQTAVVVGPAGEEIYTDQYGRVKVQFHWDREGQRNENSSCWIRVSHPWAGKNWGAVSIPRIGQEVIVDFLEGNPDQPIITGRVYNGDTMPPYALPGAAVISGIKSDTHKGQGYNEISMDDTAGDEKITIHAQYDMNTTVEHDQTNAIKNNRTTTVTVDDTLTVDANRTMHVKGQLSETVDAGHLLTVKGGLTEDITDGRTITVTGPIDQSSTATTDLHATGAGTYTSDTSLRLAVMGSTIEITPDAITLSVGASTVKIDPAGVSISAPKISLNG